MTPTKSNPNKARDLVLKAHEEEKQGNFAQAVQLLSEAIALDDLQPSWYSAYGRSLEKLERFEEALEFYEKAATMANKPNPSFLRLLGVCALRLGYEYKAKNALRLAVAAGLNSSKIDAVLADLEQRLNIQEEGLTPSNNEMSPIYYDYVYSASEKNKHSDFEIYISLWDKIIEKIEQAHNCHTFLDLGCGPGIFARFLLDRLPYIIYTGVDFSHMAIQMGRQSCPEATFINTDVFKTSLLTKHSYEAIIATEFLEHIEHDLELLGRVKTNTLFFGSVPNYYAIGHIRYFKTAQAVYDRYASSFKTLSVEEVPIGNNRILYLLHGVL